jgi:putative toxin-antitoxin system antitoxin component (TIGR02293 family)
MLTTYDARAVATLMGMAFLEDAPPPPGRAVPAAATFRISVNGAPMRIVELGPDDRLAAFPANRDLAGAPAGFAARRIASPSAVFIEKAVEQGLPREALRHLAETLAGGDRSKVAALEWGIVPKTTLERRTAQLSPQESERTERVARLFVHARRALGTEAEAREFMTTSHPELEGRSPIDAARTDLGTRRVEQLLTALEYGLAL